jgi:hypothetical protein
MHTGNAFPAARNFVFDKPEVDFFIANLLQHRVSSAPAEHFAPVIDYRSRIQVGALYQTV